MDICRCSTSSTKSKVIERGLSLGFRTYLMIDLMNHPNAFPICRPRTTMAKTAAPDVLEEVRQLRASLAVYQKIVERLTENNRAA